MRDALKKYYSFISFHQGNMTKLASVIERPFVKLLYAIASRSSILGRHSRKARDFYEAKEFPFLPKVLGKKDILVRETRQLLKQDSKIPSFQHIAQLPEERRKTLVDENWKNLVLFLNGKRVNDNCKLCPGITAILEEDIPGVKTALLSILHGKTRIAEHRGEQNGLLRLHIPIVIPSGRVCGLSVNGKVRYWSEGQAIVFDHSFPHFAWNDSDEIRVILIVDFDRELRFPWSSLNRLAIKAIAKTQHFQEIMDRSRFPNPDQNLPSEVQLDLAERR